MLRKFYGAGALAALALATPLTQLVASPAEPASTTSAAIHQRIIPLEGGNNFRDLGGYKTKDGHSVKWGLLYRSAAMNNLTPRDFTTLRQRGIKVVCDFRDNQERADAPVNWPNKDAPEILTRDYSMNSAELMKGLMSHKVTGEQTRTMMATLYRDLPYQFAGQYKQMFAKLVAGQAPLAFNCSAGKDRTGVAAALLLSALGVPYDTVMKDYLLSNTYYKPAMAKDNAQLAAFISQMPPEVITALMGVDRSYLDSAFASIRAKSGSVDAYYRDELDLSKKDIATLRRLYLN